MELLRCAEFEEVRLLAPSTIYSEFFNAVWQQHRVNSLPLQDLRLSWEQFAMDPVFPCATEELMHRSAEIAFE